MSANNSQGGRSAAFTKRGMGQHGHPIVKPVCPTVGPDGRVLVALDAEEMEALRRFWDERGR